MTKTYQLTLTEDEALALCVLKGAAARGSDFLGPAIESIGAKLEEANPELVEKELAKWQELGRPYLDLSVTEYDWEPSLTTEPSDTGAALH